MMFNFYASALLLVLAILFHQGTCLMQAIANLYINQSTQINGTMVFTQENANTYVRVLGTISGLTPNTTHGLHVHTDPVSESFPLCSTTDGHFNPYNTSHGGQTDNITSRHVGDLGNVTADSNGVINVDITDWIIQLYNSTQYIGNRTIVLHQNPDDGGHTNAISSNTTGNSGSPILCGLIKLVQNTTTTTVPCSVGTLTMQLSTSVLLIGMILNSIVLN